MWPISLWINTSYILLINVTYFSVNKYIILLLTNVTCFSVNKYIIPLLTNAQSTLQEYIITLLIITTVISFLPFAYTLMLYMCSSWPPSTKARAAWQWDTEGSEGAGRECGVQVPGVCQHLHWTGPGAGSLHSHWTAARWAQGLLVGSMTGLFWMKCHRGLVAWVFWISV